jgi:putative ABC transport system permease protein
MAIYLSFKEIWRNRTKYFLFSLVIALISVLVLFTAGLGEGLATNNKEYLEKLDADLLVFQSDVNFSTIQSRLAYKKYRRAKRIGGIADAGPIAFSNVKVVVDQNEDPVDVSFIGVEPERPGAPRALIGNDLQPYPSKIALIDQSTADILDIQVGDQITIKSTQGTEDKLYHLTVTGIAGGQRYFFRPSIFVSLSTWDKYRPKADPNNYTTQPVLNVIAVKAKPGTNILSLETAIINTLDDVEVTDITTAYESAPGYSEQQGTLNTIKGFTFLIGTLVIGGFFQIQILQKLPQIGMLKAIGAPNLLVSTAAISQIIIVSLFGVIIGTLATFALAATLPSNVPVYFTTSSITITVGTLLLIGPVGGMLSIRMAHKVEPLTALDM